MDMEYMKPAEIEKRSFEIITQELGDRQFPEEIAPVSFTPQRILIMRIT